MSYSTPHTVALIVLSHLYLDMWLKNPYKAEQSTRQRTEAMRKPGSSWWEIHPEVQLLAAASW